MKKLGLISFAASIATVSMMAATIQLDSDLKYQVMRKLKEFQ